MTEPLRPLILTQRDLEEAWLTLMQPLGFSGHSIWMMVIDQDHALPQLTEMVDSVEPLDTARRQQLAEVLRLLARSMPEVRFAFLRSRPGRGEPDSVDLTWAACLYGAARLAGVPCEVVHLATADGVVPMPLDALPASGPTRRSA